MVVNGVGKEFEQYAEQTTIHGIKDFILTKWKPLKIAWGLFILGALGLMCEEIYRTTKNFEEAPTAMDVKIVNMNHFPAIYFWTRDWWDDTEARRLGFDDKNLAYISKVLPQHKDSEDPLLKKYADALSANSTLKDEQIAEIKAKMLMNNLSMVEDMVNIVSWNFSESDKRRYVPTSDVRMNWAGVLHTIRFEFPTGEDAYIGKQVELHEKEGYIVFGEDPYGTAYKFVPQPALVAIYTVEVQAVNRVTVLKDRSGGCNEQYESSFACLHDCEVIQRAYCLCNGTTAFPTYSNNENFWQLHLNEDMKCDYDLNDQCNEKYTMCADNCRPCTIWNHQISVSTVSNEDTSPGEQTKYGWIDIKSVSRMQVSTEYYTYKMASFLGDIGGLVSLFCGASVLSFVQLIMFCCGERIRGKRNAHDGDDQKLNERFHQFRNKHC